MSHFTHIFRKLGFFIGLICLAQSSLAQAIGGNTVYNFISLPYTAKATALGGMNISRLGSDIGLAMCQPALLDPEMDGQMQLSVKPYFAGINQYDLSTVKYHPKHHIVWSGALHYMDYGTIQSTDMAGNLLGTIRPQDYMLQSSIATDYKNNFHFGATLKLIHSNYANYRSLGVAMDVGLNYVPYNGLSQASILVSNMGAQIKKNNYPGTLPFNIIIGYSKKLEQAPLQFSITAQRMSVWNTSYNDAVFNRMEGLTAPNEWKNVLNHLILGAEWSIGNQVHLNLGYNFLRRNELNIQNQTNGMNGFSSGFHLELNKTMVQYANSFFQHQLSHHITIIHRIKK